MRKLIFAAAAAGAVLGGGLIAPAARAQPYGYYAPVPIAQPGYRYDDDGRPYFDDGDRAAPYDAYDDARVPYDRYGPDPNGMIAPDGHRIKCKLRDLYDDRLDRDITRRVCD